MPLSISTLAPSRPAFVRNLFLACLAWQLSAANLHADVGLPAIFSDHMVLQKSAQVPVWGKAAPGEAVAVTLGALEGKTFADENGRWRVSLDLTKAGPGPEKMVVAGKNRLEILDVLIGEVWLCSGQSNMEFLLSRTIDAEQNIAGATVSQLREFKVKRRESRDPLEECQGSWVVASPATAGNFSAVAYFFGKELNGIMRSPVGLITAAVGATPSEAWTSYHALSLDPELKAATDRDISNASEYPAKKTAYVQAFRSWEQTFQRTDVRQKELMGKFAAFEDQAGWKEVSVPMKTSLPEFSVPGALWLVRSIELPAAETAKDLSWLLGYPEGFESLYWNGNKVSQRTLENFRGEHEGRSCSVPAKFLKPGKNIVAIRIFNPVAAPRLTGKVSYPGEYLAKMESTLPPLTPEAKAALPAPLLMAPDPKQTGSLLFNGMIRPLVPYAISGVIWYQGENNAERAWQYRKAFPLLIQDWRTHWGRTDLPFYYCQLANYHEKSREPAESDWAELREAQSAALSLPATGQAVLIDAGEAGDIHPRNKRVAGERLAAIALAETYGKSVPFSGPVLKSSSLEGSKIRVQFDHGPLQAKPLPPVHWISTKANRSETLTANSPDSQVEGFAICGSDKKWKWANATIDGDAVVVESAAVPNPVAVRYGWAKNPTCNLYNKTGFPAVPFRTDPFPAITLKSKY